MIRFPSHGRTVQICVAVRRFRCAEPDCLSRIFAEPLGDAVAGRSARRTSRLEAIVHHLGVALGGRPAASLARRLMLPDHSCVFMELRMRLSQGLSSSV